MLVVEPLFYSNDMRVSPVDLLAGGKELGDVACNGESRPTDLCRSSFFGVIHGRIRSINSGVKCYSTAVFDLKGFLLEKKSCS